MALVGPLLPPKLSLPPEDAKRYVSFMHRELNRKIYEQLIDPDLRYHVNSQKDQPLLDPQDSFAVNKDLPFPSDIKRLLAERSTRLLTGLFTMINCFYFITQNQIHIWNYEFGIYQTFKNPIDNILSAQIVVPKSGIFPPEYAFILVLANSTGIQLFGVELENKLNIKLQVTGYFVPLTFDVTVIAGTALGRIFMGSDHGCVYEFNYQKEDTFFYKKASVVNCSKSFIASIPLSLGLFRPKNSIVSLEIDEQRKTLYALSELSEIMVVNLGLGGDEFNFISTESNALQALRSSPGASGTRLCAIKVIPPSDSKSLRLLAVTDKSHVIFFRSSKDTSPRIATGLVADSIRNSPADFSSHPNFTGHIFCYFRSTLILGTSERNDFSKIAIQFLSRTPEEHKNEIVCLYNTTKHESELFNVIEINPPSQLTYSLLASSTLIDDLVGQYYQPARKFCLLDSEGTSTIIKLRPIDQLLEIVSNVGSKDPKFISFLHRYGPSETCAMILALLSGYPLAMPQINLSVKSIYDKSFLIVQPCPVLCEKLYHIFSEICDSGLPEALQPFEYSSAFSGLLIFSTRLLSPIWTLRVFSISTNPDKSITAKFVIPHDTILFLRRSISELLKSISRLPRFASDFDCSNDGAILESEAISQLKVLLLLSSDALTLLNLMYERFNTSFTRSLPPDFVQKLVNVTIEFLLAAPSRNEIISWCIDLLSTPLAPSSGVFNLSPRLSRDSLRSMFKDLSGEKIHHLTKAFDLLKDAEIQKNPEVRSSQLTQAQKHFIQTNELITFDQLKQIVAKYNQFDLQIDGLTLISKCISSLDPKLKESQKLKSYYLLVKIPLGSLSSTLKNEDKLKLNPICQRFKQLLSLSNDQLFHSTIYSWLLKNNMNMVLCHVAHTSYFTSFLQNIDLPEKQDLLTQFFIVNGLHESAAKSFMKAAASECSLVSNPKLKHDLLSQSNGFAEIQKATHSTFLPKSHSNMEHKNKKPKLA